MLVNMSLHSCPGNSRATIIGWVSSEGAWFLFTTSPSLWMDTLSHEGNGAVFNGSKEEKGFKLVVLLPLPSCSVSPAFPLFPAPLPPKYSLLVVGDGQSRVPSNRLAV